jgi:hypothetical protein
MATVMQGPTGELDLNKGLSYEALNIDEELICSKCKCLMNDPYQTECGCHYCYKCALQ